MTCDCACAGQSLDLQPGFCHDENGACTVPKVYDEPTKTFFCPTAPAPARPEAETKNPGAIALDPSCGKAKPPAARPAQAHASLPATSFLLAVLCSYSIPRASCVWSPFQAGLYVLASAESSLEKLLLQAIL